MDDRPNKENQDFQNIEHGANETANTEKNDVMEEKDKFLNCLVAKFLV